MTGEPRQLPLDLPHEPSFAREDFLSAPANAQALRAIDAWPDWAGRMLLLIGPAGSGKSHLGAIWARAAQAVTIEAEALLEASPAELARSKAILIENADRVGSGEANLFHLFNLARESGAYLLLTARGAPDNWGLDKPDLRSRLRLAPVVALGEPDAELARARAILIENAERIGAGEANLFHLINLAREGGSYLLMTAHGAPDHWALEKPDLRSRLRLAPIVALGEPDAELARAVLFKLFSDRQIAVDPAVIAYIGLRIDRSLGAARAIVEALDREALARGKAVTRSMAASMFKDIEGEG